MRRIVVAAAVIRRRGKVLITQRLPGSSLSTKWEFPGGTVKKGERLESCLRREIKEELRVRISVLSPYHTSRYFYRGRVFEIHYFLCRLIKGKPRALEVNDYCWIEPGQHASYSLLAPDAVVMKMLAVRDVGGRS